MKTAMKTLLPSMSCLAMLLTGPALALALAPGDVVDNFRLLDQNGKSHELRYYSDMKAVVLMTYANGCAREQQSIPALGQLRAKYQGQGVEFLLLDSNLADDRDSIHAAAAKLGYDFPILIDDVQLIGESLGVQRTSEVFVVNPATGKLALRGSVEDLAARDGLAAVLDGRAVSRSTRADTRGCAIALPEQARRKQHASISYAKQIAPLLQEKCVSCHQTGGVGPWAMTHYDMIKGFAPMIREVVRTQRMPPWHADPHYQTFQGARVMSAEQRKLLVHWIEAGAPRGTGTDPLLAVKPDTNEWKHGKPDLVVEIPPFEVPATGVIEYQYPRVKNSLGRDVWITAVELHPGERSVLHHLIANEPVVVPARAGETSEQRLQRERSVQRSSGSLAGFAPGMLPIVYPKDTGVFFPKDADFVFQMHYTPNGKAVTDRSKAGFFFREANDPPKFPLRVTALVDFRFTIPPGAKEHYTQVKTPVTRDMLAYNIMPHSHLRGKVGKMTAIYPDGRQEVLLHVPRYDFNWQTVYSFVQPKVIPAGSQLVWDFAWDNSRQNRANPNPDIPVRWGDQTFEEMGIGFIRFRYLDEEVGKPAPAAQTSAR